MPSSAPRLPLPPPMPMPVPNFAFPHQQQPHSYQYPGLHSPMQHTSNSNQGPYQSNQSQNQYPGSNTMAPFSGPPRLAPGNPAVGAPTNFNPALSPRDPRVDGRNLHNVGAMREPTATTRSTHTTINPFSVPGQTTSPWPGEGSGGGFAAGIQQGMRPSIGGIGTGRQLSGGSPLQQQPWGGGTPVAAPGAGGGSAAAAVDGHGPMTTGIPATVPGGSFNSPVSSLPSSHNPAVPASTPLWSVSDSGATAGYVAGGAPASGSIPATVPITIVTGGGGPVSPQNHHHHNPHNNKGTSIPRELARLLSSSHGKRTRDRISTGIGGDGTTRTTAIMPVEGSKGETDRTVEVSRYGRARVKPLAYWSSERLVMGVNGEGAQGIHKGSEVGDLVFGTTPASASKGGKSGSVGKTKRRLSVGAIGGVSKGGGGGGGTPGRGGLIEGKTPPNGKGTGQKGKGKTYQPDDRRPSSGKITEEMEVSLEVEHSRGKDGQQQQDEQHQDVGLGKESARGSVRGRGRGQKGKGRGDNGGRGAGGSTSAAKSPTPMRKSNPKSTPMAGGKISRKKRRDPEESVDGDDEDEDQVEITPARSRPSKISKIGSRASGLATLAAAAGVQAAVAAAAAKNAATPKGGKKVGPAQSGVVQGATPTRSIIHPPSSATTPATAGALTPSVPPPADPNEVSFEELRARSCGRTTGVTTTGKNVQSKSNLQSPVVVGGLSADRMATLASTPKSKLPTRCGECPTCLATGPGRKKACLVIKALKETTTPAGGGSTGKKAVSRGKEAKGKQLSGSASKNDKKSSIKGEKKKAPLPEEDLPAAASELGEEKEIQVEEVDRLPVEVVVPETQQQQQPSIPATGTAFAADDDIPIFPPIAAVAAQGGKSTPHQPKVQKSMKQPQEHEEEEEVKVFSRQKPKGKGKRVAEEDNAPPPISSEGDHAEPDGPRRSTRQRGGATTSAAAQQLEQQAGNNAGNSKDTTTVAPAGDGISVGDLIGAAAGPSTSAHQQHEPSSKAWSADELVKLKELTYSIESLDSTDSFFWQKIAKQLPGRSANECFNRIFDEHPTPHPPKKSKGSRLLEAMNEKAGKELDVRPGASKKAIKNAVRKKGQQERLQKKAEQLAAGSGDDQEMGDVLVKQRDNARYVDQILRGRNGRPLGGTGLRSVRPPAAPAVVKIGSNAAEKVTAALAAARENQDVENSDEEGDYYWSDAE